MEELLQKLQSLHGLSAEQSHSILNTITTYIKEKFPMVSGAVDNLFPTANATSEVTAASNATDSTIKDGGSFLDKISDYIPGSTGEKIEDFAKSKLGSMFGNDKS